MKDNWLGDDNGLYIQTESGKYIYYDGLMDTVIGIIDNEWHHIAVSREGTGADELKLYFDANLTATATDSRTLTNSKNLRIGTDSDGSNYFDGYIDEVVIYNRKMRL